MDWEGQKDRSDARVVQNLVRNADKLFTPSDRKNVATARRVSSHTQTARQAVLRSSGSGGGKLV